jgi:hypothetical protein
MFRLKTKNEKGSLALEQVLFIGAVVAMSAGIFAFYQDISGYFNGVDMSSVGNVIPNPTSTPSN